MLKRGTKFRIAPYGACVVSSYDDTSGKYIMRVWNSSETFYASQEEIDKINIKILIAIIFPFLLKEKYLFKKAVRITFKPIIYFLF